VNKFLLSRPAFDLDDVPMFYSLFNSSSTTYRHERLWLLRMLAVGCQNPDDYRLLRKRRVIDLVAHLYVTSHSRLALARRCGLHRRRSVTGWVGGWGRSVGGVGEEEERERTHNQRCTVSAEHESQSSSPRFTCALDSSLPGSGVTRSPSLIKNC
jgi:hypothetical protein